MNNHHHDLKKSPLAEAVQEAGEASHAEYQRARREACANEITEVLARHGFAIAFIENRVNGQVVQQGMQILPLPPKAAEAPAPANDAAEAH